MKVQVFNQSNVKSFRRGATTLSFNVKSGLVGFSKAAGEMLGLRGGERVSLCLNEEVDKRGDVSASWYLMVGGADDSGFSVRCDGKDRFGFNSVHLCKLLLGRLGLSGRASFRIGHTPIEEDGVRYWFLMTGKSLVDN